MKGVIFDKESAGRIATVVRRVEREQIPSTAPGPSRFPIFSPLLVQPFKAGSSGIPAGSSTSSTVTPASASGCSLYDDTGSSWVLRSEAVTIYNDYPASVSAGQRGWCVTYGGKLYVLTAACT